MLLFDFSTFYFLNKIFSTYCTEIVGLKSRNTELFNFKNSTARIECCKLVQNGNFHIIKVSEDSTLFLDSDETFLDVISDKGIILCSGKIFLYNTSIILPNNSCSLCSPLLSSNDCAVFEMASCSMKDISSSNNTFSLTSNGRIIDQKVNDCYFYNLSVFPRATPVKKDKKTKRYGADYFVIERSYFDKVENAYGGLISAQGQSSYSSSIMNTSFINCTSISKTRETFISSFSSNNSLYMISSDGPGGAFYFEGPGKSFFYSCTFFRCRNTKEDPSSDVDGSGGAICDLSNKPVRLNCTSFIECSSPRIGACYYSQTNSSSDSWKELLNCYFSGCKTNHYGSVVILKSKHNTKIIDCRFEHCESTGYGGALTLSLPPFEEDSSLWKWFVANNSFCHNHAGYAGGAIYMERKNSGFTSVVNNLFFVNNTLSDGNKNGYDIAFHHSYLDFINNTFPESYSTNNDDNHRTVICSRVNDNCKSYTPFPKCLSLFEPIPLLILYVDKSGYDVNGCGEDKDSKRCKSIGFVVDNYDKRVRAPITLCLNGSTENKVSISEKFIEIISKDKGNYKIQSNATYDALFTVSTGILKISYVDFFHNPNTSNNSKLVIITKDEGKVYFTSCNITSKGEGDKVLIPLNTPLFDLTKGTLSLININLFNIMMSKCSLIKLSTESNFVVTIRNVIFENITRNEGDGTVFSHIFKNNQSIKLTNITNEGCKGSKGDGGVICMELQDFSKALIGGKTFETSFVNCEAKEKDNSGGRGGGICLHINNYTSKFILERLKFNGCKADVAGNNVYIYSTILDKIINNNTIKLPLNESVNDWMGSFNGKGNDSIPLSFLIRLWDTPVYISKSKGVVDNSLCGFNEYPCKTISYAVVNRFNNNDRAEISLLEGFRFVDKTELSGKEFIFTGTNVGKEVDIGGEGVIEGGTGNLMNVSTKITMRNISFHLLDKFGSYDAFLYISNNNTIINGCNVSFVEELGRSIRYSFCCVGGGLLSIKKVSMRGNSNVMLLKRSLIIIKSGGNSNMRECKFCNISLTNGNGSCINAFIGKENKLFITNSTFNGCKIDKGNGGALHATLCSCGDFSLKNMEFIKCKVNQGKGGALFINYSNLCDNVSFGSFKYISFKNCEVGNDYNNFNGNYFYLLFNGSQDVINSQLKNFFTGLMESVNSNYLAAGSFCNNDTFDLYDQKFFFVGTNNFGDGFCSSDNNCEIEKALVGCGGKEGKKIIIDTEYHIKENGVIFYKQNGDNKYAINNNEKNSGLIKIGSSILDGGSEVSSSGLLVESIVIIEKVNVFVVNVKGSAITVRRNGILSINGSSRTNISVASPVVIGMSDKTHNNNLVNISDPLIKVESGSSLVLNIVNIQNFRANADINGVCISFIYGKDNGSLKLTSVKFENITNDKGKGGILYVNYKEQSILNVEELFLLSFANTTTFEKEGKNIYVVAKSRDDLKRIAKKYYDIHLLYEKNLSFGCFEDMKENKSVDLKSFFNNLYVDDGSVEDGNRSCRDNSKDICKTLQYALGIQAGNSDNILHIVNNVIIKEKINVTNPYKGGLTKYFIEKNESNSSLIFSGGCFFSSQDLHISLLSISFINISESNSLFIQRSGILSLYGVFIEGMNGDIITFNHSLIDVKRKGGVVLINFSINRNLSLTDDNNTLILSKNGINRRRFSRHSIDNNNSTLENGRNRVHSFFRFSKSVDYGHFARIKFNNCLAKGVDSYYLISAPCLQEVADSFKDSILNQSTPDGAALGRIGDNDTKDLKLYLPSESLFFVGDDGVDDGHDCTNKQSDGNLCGSLNKVIEVHKGDSQKTIIVIVNVTVSTDISILDSGVDGKLYKIEGENNADTDNITFNTGSFTFADNVAISYLNLEIETIPSGNVIIQEKKGLTLQNISIGSLYTGNSTQLTDSLIKIYGGATLTISLVNIQNIELIGGSKYGGAFTIDFRNSVLNGDGKFNTLNVSNLTLTSVTADGVNAFGDYYYLLFKDNQIVGSKPSEIRNDMRTKVEAISTIDDEGKVYYSLDEGVTIKDLNKVSLIFFVDNVNSSDECGKESIDPCDLQLAVSTGENINNANSVKIFVGVDNAVVTGSVSFDNANISTGYNISKEDDQNRSITLGIDGDENSTSSGLSSSQNLFIIQVNIYIANMATDANALIISGDSKKLSIAGKDNDSAVIIGGNGVNVDVTGSLIKVYNKASVDLQNVILQFVTLKGVGKYGVALNVDFIGMSLSGNTSYPNIDLTSNVTFDRNSLLTDSDSFAKCMMLTFDNTQINDSSSKVYAIKEKVKTLSGLDSKYYNDFNLVYYQVTVTMPSPLDLYSEAPDVTDYLYVSGVSGSCTVSNQYDDSIACESINSAIANITNDTTGILIRNISLTETNGNTLSYSVVIMKDDSLNDSETNVSVCTGSNILFSLNVAKTLAIDDITFYISDNNIPTSNVISIMNGKLLLTSCIFKEEGSSFCSASIIKVESGSLIVEGCSFLGCKTDNGNNGAAVSVSVEGSNKLSISQSVFKSCVTSGGLGGAIFINISDEIDNGSILVSEITFGSNSENNSALQGNNLFVCSYSFTSDVITKERFPVIDEYNSSPDSLIGCWSNYSDNVVKYYKLLYLFEDDGNKYVGSNGDDRNNGSLNIPYLTINSACTKTLGSLNTIILIDELEPETKQTTFDKEITMKPLQNSSDTVSIKVGQLIDASNGNVPLILFTINSDTSSVNFERIKFEIQHDTSTIPKESIILVETGNFKIKSCIFEKDLRESVSSDSPLYKSVIFISGGSTDVNSCNFLNIYLSSGDGAAISYKTEDGSIVLVND